MKLASAFLVVSLAAAPAASALSFPQSVASGDVTSTSAVLWTRADGPAELVAEVATDLAFQRVVTSRRMAVSADGDFVAKLLIESLDPGQTYFYRWRSADATSEAGTFKTAPRREAAASLRFAFSGDSDGTLRNGAPALNHFEALDAARSEGLDFFIYLGDTIYSDSEFRSGGHPAETLDQYRDAYKVNRDLPALRDLLRATSVYAIWDDHEVRNDYQGQTVDRNLYAAGRRAFLDYLPVREDQFPDRATCAGDPLFRLFHWGALADIIVIDERSCRSAEALSACTAPDGAADPAPTLPAALRGLAGLPPAPPPGCLATLFDPQRTMLGGFQKLVFKAALLYSKAKFKFVVNEVAIQQLYGLPYDRWEGYAAERAEILSFIRDNNIQNVIFLTADLHANIMGGVYVDRAADRDPVAQEVLTGPIATTTLGSVAETVPGALGLFNLLAPALGVTCSNLNTYSYGLVEVNAAAGSATITLKDDKGNVVRDQSNPSVLCAKTIGP